MATVILLSNWSYQEFMRFNTAYSTGDLELAFVLAQKVITSWDLDADLNDPEVFLDLNPVEATSVLREIILKTDEFTGQIDRNNVEVDLTQWTTRDLLKFTEFQKTHQWGKVEPMLHKVASIEGVNPDKPLSAPDGMAMQVAITEKYRRVAEGKN